MNAASAPRGGARSAGPALEVVSISWVRVQVHLRLRAADGELDPRAVRLRHETRDGAGMPATGWQVEPGVLLLRFNVMQGPGQVPLAPGRWRLVAGQGGGDPREVPVRVALAPGVDAAAAATTFMIERLEDVVAYRVVPQVASGALELEVSLRERAAPAPQRPRGHRARTGAFRLVFAGFRAVARRNGRRILFSSDSRSGLGGNLALVHDRMVERGLDAEYELRTLFKPHLAARRPLLDRVRLAWLLARSDTIVIDDFQPIIYSMGDPRSRIVQLWHAVGAFKTVGYSRVGKPGAPDPWGAAHKNYSHAIVSSGADVPVYAEAFGIPESRVVATGIPRVDRFFDPAHRERAREAAYAEFPAARGRTTILFAPTFRGNGAWSASYDFDRLDYPALHELCVERDAVCIVRMHPFVREPAGIPDALADRLIDGSKAAIDVNDLLFAVDLLVTDYSSIVYEFSILGRPMLFYAYDLEDYVASRDFYEPYESFVPGRIVRTFPELLDAIRREDYAQDRVAPFAARHFDHLDAGSTDRVIDLILS